MQTRLSRAARNGLCVALAVGAAAPAAGQRPPPPRIRFDTVLVPSGALTLYALRWRPAGRGPFPAVLFHHGSGTTAERQAAQAQALGPVFARHGFAFFYLYRRGSGLSAAQGTAAADLMDRELRAHGPESRNALQLRLLEGDQLQDAFAGLAYVRTLPDVDLGRIVLAGHSFGASLALLEAEQDTLVRAVVVFSGSAATWDRSPALRHRLRVAAGRARAAEFFLQARNDYSIAPAESLSAERARRGKPYRVKIYPAVGRTADEGHDFPFLQVRAWEADVFAFLNAHLRQ